MGYPRGTWATLWLGSVAYGSTAKLHQTLSTSSRRLLNHALICHSADASNPVTERGPSASRASLKEARRQTARLKGRALKRPVIAFLVFWGVVLLLSAAPDTVSNVALAHWCSPALPLLATSVWELLFIGAIGMGQASLVDALESGTEDARP